MPAMGWGALEESARDQVALLERSEFAETLD